MRLVSVLYFLLAIILTFQAAYAEAPQISEPVVFNIIQNKPCEVMESTMSWRNGDSISLSVVQEKIKNMPGNVSLTPVENANQLLDLKGIDQVKFYCEDSSVDNRVATLTFTYETNGNINTMPAITVTILRLNNN